MVSQSNEEKPEKVSEDTTYAPNTLATDGLRIYATFPSGDIAAFDLNGRKLCSLNYSDIARSFMEIFLGENTRSASFTRALRGG